MKTGVLCISIDLELLWGRRISGYTKYRAAVLLERDVIRRLLAMLAKYKIHATWAVVGHLFLSECSPVKREKHPEVIRSPLAGKEDWFKPDPCTNVKKDPEWYGSDIVSLIQKTPGQEIGCHSFSHVNYGDSKCQRKTAESEIIACKNLARRQGVKLQSFVFPYNDIGHLSVLKKHMFTSFRGNEKHWYKSMPLVLKKIIALIDFFLPISPPVYSPSVSSGLVNIPASFYFVSGRGKRKYIPYGVRYQKARRGIIKAVKEKKVFHLWFHPIDLLSEDKHLLRELEEILSYASHEAKKGSLASLTMGEIASTGL